MPQKEKYVLAEGKMEITFEPERWAMLRDGIFNDLTFEAVVNLNTGTKAKINIVAEDAGRISSEDFEDTPGSRFASISSRITPGQNYFVASFGRVLACMAQFFLTESPNWLIFGYVKSRDSKRPIVIMYSEISGVSFYSMKRSTDTEEGRRKSFDPTLN